MANKAIFLDRDGVINVERNYVHKIEDFKLYSNTIQAFKKIPQEYKKIIVTNQGGIGKGYYTERDYENVTRYMIELFDKENVKIDRIYHCSHHDGENCKCRKPGIQMLLDAKEENNINLHKSYFIGDKISDIIAGKNAGCKTILVKTGHGLKNYKLCLEKNVNPEYIAEDILDAINFTLENRL